MHIQVSYSLRTSETPSPSLHILEILGGQSGGGTNTNQADEGETLNDMRKKQREEKFQRGYGERRSTE
jgi:hypothetical protein